MNYHKVSKAMDEVHKWRKEIYEETKDMPLKEKLNFFHRISEKTYHNFGLRVLRPETAQ